MTTPLARHRARGLTTANVVTLTTTVPPSTQTAASPLAHCDRQRLQPDQPGDLGRMNLREVLTTRQNRRLIPQMSPDRVTADRVTL
jgi:hypothetical protein